MTYNYHNCLKCLQIVHLECNSQRYALKKILNGSGKDELEKMLLVAHWCILQHLFLRHHDHKNALMKRTSWTAQGIRKSSLQPMCLSHIQVKFLFPFSQCPLSAGSIQIQTRIPLTWNRNHGFTTSKNSMSISLTRNISTSIFLDLRQIVYTSQTSSALSFLFVAV